MRRVVSIPSGPPSITSRRKDLHGHRERDRLPNKPRTKSGLDCFRYAPNPTEWSARQLERRTVEQHKGRSAFGTVQTATTEAAEATQGPDFSRYFSRCEKSGPCVAKPVGHATGLLSSTCHLLDRLCVTVATMCLCSEIDRLRGPVVNGENAPS